MEEPHGIPLLGSEGVACPGYLLTEEEKDSDAEYEKEREDFGRTFSINNKLA